eukprot:TRINITY_DN31352_c0_g1_i1.p1 TRINITY_DN31352_c0_g1~~TRINITY_DN31352_c0_g1_i1.p1  ORF type:complete len:902 (-),score=160.98 TRINITY_DN31352_c0_g1_i1:137-2842(-)
MLSAGAGNDRPGTSFVHNLLEALLANAEQLGESRRVENTDTEEPFEDLPALHNALGRLRRSVKQFTPKMLSEVLYELSLVTWQLRAWFTPGAGSLIVSVLDRLGGLTHRLPQPSCGADPGLAVIRLLEGVVLMSLVRYGGVTVRAEALKVVERILQKRRLPPCSSVRLEASLVSLGGFQAQFALLPSPANLDDSTGESWLRALAKLLVPDDQAVAKSRRTKAKLENLVASVFPGAKPEYFGSAVNGFELGVSDVDAVVVLPPSAIDLELHSSATALNDSPSPLAAPSVSPKLNPITSPKMSPQNLREQKTCAAAAVKFLGEAIRSREELQAYGFTVDEMVTEARVPVLKCMSDEGVAVDLTFNNRLPLHNSQLLRSYAELDSRVADLGRIVKFWAKKRHVNDAQNGTLSSYSHVLLVVHYLQYVGVLPNLQDKNNASEQDREAFGETAHVDGIHDVWFLNPSMLDKDASLWRTWASQSHHTATLSGLLHGFFRYCAYEIAAHSEVVSIRHSSGRLAKDQYFRAVIAAKKAAGLGQEPGLETEVPEVVEPLEPALMSAEGLESDEDEWPADFPDKVDDEDELQETIEEETSPAQKEDAPPAQKEDAPPAQKEDAPPAQKYKLQDKDHEIQQAMSSKQTLCIDDPMELGRCLGASYAGFERLVFEWRRACHLLQHPISSEEEKLQHLREVFSDDPAPPQALWKLEEQRTFPSLVEMPCRKGQDASASSNFDNTARASIKMPIAQEDIGRFLGKGGCNIRELQQNSPGVLGLRLVNADESAGREEAVVRISGISTEAVEACRSRIIQLLSARTPSSHSPKKGDLPARRTWVSGKGGAAGKSQAPPLDSYYSEQRPGKGGTAGKGAAPQLDSYYGCSKSGKGKAIKGGGGKGKKEGGSVKGSSFQ